MKRVLLIAIVVGVIVVAAGWWYHRQQLLAGRRTEAAEAAAVDAALQERIDTTSFAGTERPWGEVLDKLQSRCDVPLVVNEAEAAALGVDRQTSVNVPDGVFPLAELLDEITGRMDLSWRRTGRGLEITSYDLADTSRSRLVTRVYPLPAAAAGGAKLTDDSDLLCDLITTSIEPDSWDQVGGKGVIQPAGGALIVIHTADVQNRVRAFLTRLADLPAGMPRHFPLSPTVQESEPLLNALSSTSSLDCDKRPLAQVLAQLAARHEISIRINQAELDASLESPDVPVTQSFNNVSLQAILRETLAPSQLTYVVQDGALQVTTQDDADYRLETWFYDVRDLVAFPGGNDIDTLIDLLTTTIDPDSWDNLGGPGTISELDGGWLVVVQSQATHRQLQRVLARIRAHLEPGMDLLADFPLDPMDDIAPKILSALDKEVTLRYKDRPLAEVFADLSQRLAIPIIPRRFRLDEVAVPLETPVTCDLPPLPLRYALAILLADFDLGLDPRGEVIIVTSQDDLESVLETRVIDVRHLLDPASGGFHADKILDLVTTSVDPDTWGELGGPGSIEIFRGLLVFRQTWDVSRQVLELIDALSEHCLPPTHLAGESAVDSRQPVWVSRSPGEVQLIERLALPVNYHAEMPQVREAIESLCRQTAVPVRFDRWWADDAGIDKARFTFSLSLDNVALRVALESIEGHQAAGFTVSQGMLLVIDPEEASSHAIRRLYPLHLPKLDDLPQRADQVADMFTERLEPDTWDTNGGYGAIEPVNDQWLLVVQTLTMHRRVEEALAKLERGEMLPLPISKP